MNKGKDTAGIDRRKFLFGAGLGATAVAASQLVGGDAAAMDPGPEESKARYQKTEHVMAFYKVNGYEGRK
jgi:hypothetical protein